MLADYDVLKEKTMYGKQVMSTVRTTYILDEEGKLVAGWDKVKVEGHVKEVVEKLKSL